LHGKDLRKHGKKLDFSTVKELRRHAFPSSIPLPNHNGAMATTLAVDYPANISHSDQMTPMYNGTVRILVVPVQSLDKGGGRHTNQ